MKFVKTEFDGVYIIDIEPMRDPRGFFSRTVCVDEFRQHGLNADFIQSSISFNPKSNTLRGMHWQGEPYGEEKLVRVTSGSIFDVVVDIRPHSKTYRSWFSVVLSSENHRSIYISKGFAHGFQTLENDTEVLYHMATPYNAEYSLGFKWDDPGVGIEWPDAESRIIGDRDKNFLNLD